MMRELDRKLFEFSLPLLSSLSSAESRCRNFDWEKGLAAKIPLSAAE